MGHFRVEARGEGEREGVVEMSERLVGVKIFVVLFSLGALLTWGSARSYEHLGVIWVLYARVASALQFILAIMLYQLKEWARRATIYFQIVTALISVFLFTRFVELNLPQDPILNHQVL